MINSDAQPQPSAETQALANALHFVHHALVRIRDVGERARTDQVAFVRSALNLSKQLQAVLACRPDLNVALLLDPSLSKEMQT